MEFAGFQITRSEVRPLCNYLNAIVMFPRPANIMDGYLIPACGRASTLTGLEQRWVTGSARKIVAVTILFPGVVLMDGRSH